MTGIIKITAYNFNYAGQSVVCRKEERYDRAMESYLDFKARYPESKYLNDATSIYQKSQDLKQKALTEIKSYKIECNELTKED